MKGKWSVARVRAVCVALTAAGPLSSSTSAAPSSTGGPAASSPAAGRAVPASPGSQQAEAALEQRGLTLVGLAYLVPGDVKLHDSLGKMRQAKAKLDAYVAERKQSERDVADAEAALSAANAAMVAADNRLAKANRNANDFNNYVRAANAAGARVDGVKRYGASRVKALADLPQPTGDHVGSLIEVADAMDEAAEQY